jgi:hypothetical protein
LLSLLQLFSDVAMQREILSLVIKCRNHDNGCSWTGELRDEEVWVFVCFVFVCFWQFFMLTGERKLSSSFTFGLQALINDNIFFCQTILTAN